MKKVGIFSNLASLQVFFFIIFWGDIPPTLCWPVFGNLDLQFRLVSFEQDLKIKLSKTSLFGRFPQCRSKGPRKNKGQRRAHRNIAGTRLVQTLLYRFELLLKC